MVIHRATCTGFGNPSPIESRFGRTARTRRLRGQIECQHARHLADADKVAASVLARGA